MKIGKDYIGVGVGAVIINNNNEILLLLRTKEPEAGYWTIPGGTVEFFETIESAIIREVEEELNINVNILELLCVTNHIVTNEGLHWVAPAFLVKVVGGIPTNMEPDKHLEMKWFSVNNLPKNVTITTSKALEAFKNKNSNLI